MAVASGRVVQIQGAVLDCAFPEEDLPEIYDALEIPQDGMEPLVLRWRNLCLRSRP